MTTVHTCLDGEAVDLDGLSKEVADFVALASADGEATGTTEHELTALVYGPTNPLLDHSRSTRWGYVTPQAFASPAYRVLVDLIDRVRVAEGRLDPVAAAAAYTLTVADAAAMLDVHESAVRQAIASRRLSARKVGAQWLIRPESVASYKVSRRGPPASVALRVHVAHSEELQVVARGLEIEADARGVGRGVLHVFDRAYALLDGGNVFAVLDPSPEYTALRAGDSWVAGRFMVATRVEGAAARGSWAVAVAEVTA